MSEPSSACLVVLDGWGLAPPGPGNAVALARTPVFDALWERYPHTTLTACGAAVGLPDGQMGNSEVGHLNLGAGAIVKQDLTLIDEAARLEAFGGNEVLLAALQGADARAPDRPRLRRRRAFEHRARPRAGADGGTGRRRGSRDPRVHRRPRHAADGGLGVRRDGRAAVRGGGRGTRRERRRALLRDGPRRPLGARPAGLRPAHPGDRRAHGRQRARGGARRLRAGRDRRVRQRDARRRGGHDPRGRLGHRVQLPARPHARDLLRAGRAGLPGDRSPRRCAGQRATRR